MKVSYKKLWKFLIDKDMKKRPLRKETSINSGKMRMAQLMFCLEAARL